MVLEAPERMKLPVPVGRDAQWRVVIRPARFETERIASLAECERLLAGSAVRLRGWDFPTVDERTLRRGADWIAGSVELGTIVEYWKFFQSGQFIHLSAFEENGDPRYSPENLRGRYRVPEHFHPTGAIDYLSIIYATTEIFEFASRLAVRGVLGDDLVVEVEMVGIDGRLLTSLSRWMTGFYPATAPVLGRWWATETPALIARSAIMAVDAAMWFYERFRWTDVSREGIEREQQLLLERR